MNINPKILSLPPYLSTSWKNIASLHVEIRDSQPILIVTLHNAVRIEIPNLEPAIIEEIFAAHAQFLELEEKAVAPQSMKNLPKPPSFPFGNEQLFSVEIPLKGGLIDMENFGQLLQHNPDQASAPELPQEILSRITQICKTMGIDDPHAYPKPEPDCNCIRCQIAKAMQDSLQESPDEEIVKDEELTFRTWNISQTSDKLYLVTNPIDEKEHYNVFLGDPIGCTCGEKHCEHIKAVLST